MSDPAVAPIYVLTDWDVDFFNPGPGYPIVTPLGVLIGDQPTVDAVALAAGLSRVRLTYSVTKPDGASDFPTISGPFVRFDGPQTLDDDEQAQARVNIGAARTYDTGDLG